MKHQASCGRRILAMHTLVCFGECASHCQWHCISGIARIPVCIELPVHCAARRLCICAVRVQYGISHKLHNCAVLWGGVSKGFACLSWCRVFEYCSTKLQKFRGLLQHLHTARLAVFVFALLQRISHVVLHSSSCCYMIRPAAAPAGLWVLCIMSLSCNLRIVVLCRMHEQ
jgi:hypothetical protein